MLKRLNIVFLLLCMMLLLGVGNANAVPLWPGQGTDAGTLYEDDDLDYFIDNDGDDLITPGDVLVAVFEFGKAFKLENYSPVKEVDLDTDNDELVGISRIEFQAIDPNTGLWIFGEHNNQPMVEFYTGGLNNLDVWSNPDPTLAEGQSAVTDGTFLWSFSLDPLDPDTFWTFQPLVSGANDPSVVKTTLPSTKVGVLNYALNQVGGDDIFNAIYNPSYVMDDGLVDLVGSADILGGAGLTYAFARSDADVLLNPIPEPTTMLLLGSGLIGLAALYRRRNFFKKD